MASESWSDVWRELRNNMRSQPPCPEHPEYPHVRTLHLGVINDIVEVAEHTLRVRSHRSRNEDTIEARTMETWWDHLLANGSASTDPDSANCPHIWRARVVGAILATCLPSRIEVDPNDKSTIRLL